MATVPDANHRIIRITVDNPSAVCYQRDVEREIEVAIYDLVEVNTFRPDSVFFGGALRGS
jgi:uncharacterized protein (UPF0262 family)